MFRGKLRVGRADLPVRSPPFAAQAFAMLPRLDAGLGKDLRIGATRAIRLGRFFRRSF